MDTQGARPEERSTPASPANERSSANGEGNESIDHVPMYRTRHVVIPAALVVVAALAVLWYWYLNLRDFVSSDDAYVDANRVTISAKVLGRISRLSVDEGDSVAPGQTLVQLDTADIVAQRAQALASLESAEEGVALSKVDLARAEEDYRRANQQFSSGVVTKEEHEHARAAVDAAHAEYGIALSRVGTAQAQVGIVRTQLDNCTIISPVDGQVAKRWVHQGDVVQPAQPIVSVYDRTETWVVANLEETHLHKIRVGQDVDISVDAYPDHEFTGKVLQLGSSTAGQFSLIPPNNASGNFTKVTQRIPVKISIVERSGADRLPAALLPGMSVEVKIKIR